MPRSLRHWLGTATVVALAAAVLIPAIGLWQILRARDAALADTRQTVQTLSHALSEHAVRTVQGVDLVVSGIVDLVENGGKDRDLKSFIDRRTTRLRQSHAIALVDASGAITEDSGVPHLPINISDRAYFKWHRDHADRGLHIGDIVLSRLDRRPVMSVSRRIDDRDGAFAGLAVASLLPEDFQAFYDGLQAGPHGVVALWTESGQLLVRRPRVQGEPEAAALVNTSVATVFGQARSGVVTSRSPVDDVERIVGFEHLDDYPLVVSVGMSVDDVLGRWHRDTLVQGLVLALASSVLLVLAVFLERNRRAVNRSALLRGESDRLYRLLAQNASDLVILRSRSSHSHSYVSPSSRDMLGWSAEELATLPPEALIHPQDLDRVQSELASLSWERDQLTSIHRLRHKDGRYRQVEARYRLTLDERTDDSIVVSVRDVTERVEAEEALRDSEARYRLLAERSSDMVSRLDLDAVRLYVSPASTEILGHAPADLIGTRPTDFIHEDDAARVDDVLAQLRDGAVEHVRSVHRLRHARGHWVWGEALFRLIRDPVSGRPAEIVSSLRDVTARVSLQRQVEAGASLLQATLDGMQEGLIVVGPDRTIQVCNNRAADVLELRRGSGRGEGAVAHSLADDAFSWLFDGGADPAGSSLQRQFADGRCIEVRRVPMPDGGSLLTLSDITHLKRAETEARDANRHLLIAEEVAHVGHWRLTVADRALTWSDEVYRIHGLDPAAYAPDVVSAIALYHPDDRAEVERCVSRAIAEHASYDFVLRVRRPGGELRHVVSRGRCELDPASNEVVALFGVIMDVTELAQAQRALAATSAHLQATLDNMDQGLVKVAANGDIELSNRRFAELLDLPPELVDGPAPHIEAILDHLHDRGEFARTTAEFQTNVTRRGQPLTLGTYERRRPNGQVLEVRTVALPGGSVVRTYADITTRRQAEDAVRDSEARYRMLADSTSDVITQLDLGFKRRYASPASRAVLGYAPEELIGAQPSDTIHPDDAGAVREVSRRLVAGEIEGDRAVTTYRFRHRSGHWIWIEAGINLVRDQETGAPVSLICSLRDVSERQRVARHLERAKLAAENAARAKTEFVANMSHELRTPLTGILGIHDLLQSDPGLSDRQRHLVTLARDAGRSLLAIVNDVLDFSKMEAGELVIETVAFDLKALTASCVDLVGEAAAGKGLRVEAVLSGATALKGDSNRLRQVLLNLLTNAVKFTERGVITLDATYDSRAARLRVAVSDTGIGIAADKLPALFGRFVQADASVTRRYGGTGLGLAISRHLLELMGGRIGVESEPGRGSTFWFELTLPEAPATPATGPSPQPRAVVRPRRVLLAEDNDINQAIISAMLQRHGYEVTAVGNGAAAVAALAPSSEFDVVLMDLQMPVMDGLSATRAIRAGERVSGAGPVPILGLTANALAEDVERCLMAGMDGHVAKPIAWGELFATIDQVLQSRAGSDVLNEATLDDLAGFVGRDRLTAMLATFAAEVERRLTGVESAAAPEVAARAHALVSLAGQLGFRELSRICVEIEGEARRGTGPIRLDALRTAADKAIAAARSSSYTAVA